MLKCGISLPPQWGRQRGLKRGPHEFWRGVTQQLPGKWRRGALLPAAHPPPKAPPTPRPRLKPSSSPSSLFSPNLFHVPFLFHLPSVNRHKNRQLLQSGLVLVEPFRGSKTNIKCGCMSRGHIPLFFKLRMCSVVQVGWKTKQKKR